ncbi:hypothetical protein EA472_18675 [Natrarchaeobius oligotrophus]|uniref:DUF91 domain-containing protein n=2 Tax=Natrarchaeobius TaxID=2501796 RepID=A0A3N6PEH0_NATCH|nr:hypothetical protein EA472_18675 [Natrarchaeobius chitinivorans]
MELDSQCMEVYMVEQEDLKRLPESEFDKEANLEKRLIRTDGATIGGVDVMYIGRQGTPDEGGIFDILGLDEEGNTVIVELKRGKAPREIAAQALEYASGIRKEDYEQLNQRYREFVREYGPEQPLDGDITLRDRHRTYFGLDDTVDEDDFNDNQRLILVGTEFRDVSLNMADFLREHDIDVICVEYSVYSESEVELLLTENIRRPLSEEPTSTVSSTSNAEDYSDLIITVRDHIYPQLNDDLHIEDKEQIARATEKRGMGTGSNHPDHPEPLKYGMKPLIEEEGVVRFRVNIWDAESNQHEELRRFLAENIGELEGYDMIDDPSRSMGVLHRDVKVDRNDIEVRELAQEMVDLVQFLHPRAIEEYAGHELFE